MTRSNPFHIRMPTTEEITMQLPPAIEPAALAYEPIRNDAWPTPVVRAGKLIKVPTAPLLELLATGRLPGADVA